MEKRIEQLEKVVADLFRLLTGRMDQLISAAESVLARMETIVAIKEKELEKIKNPQ